MNKLFLTAAVITAIAAVYLWPIVDQVRRVAVGYGAKMVCSGIYVSGMTMESLKNNELMGGGPWLPLLMTFGIDDVTKRIRTSCLGVSATAKYHGYHKGCSLLPRSSSYSDISSKLDRLEIIHNDKAFQWPDATSKSRYAFPDVDYEKLDKTISGEFNVHTPVGITKEEIQEDLERIRKGQTRAVVVIYKGKLVAEGYNQLLGLTKDSRLHGWSVTKSLLATLVGIRIKQNKMSLNDLANVTEWSEETIRKQGITIRNMLNMNAGIDCEEKYHVTSDVCKMIFTQDNAAGFAARFPQVNSPGEKWYYSSATSNLLAQALQNSFNTDEEYWRFPHKELFDVIGATSMVLEIDPSGTFVGSSYSYATARDWAKLGQLHLQNGVWNNRQVLPEYWSKMVSTPTKGSEGHYGAHWWLNPYMGPEKTQPERDPMGHYRHWMKSLPPDLYRAEGHEGQFVIVVPSKELVIVRLGLSRGEGSWDKEKFFSGLLDCFN